MKKIHLNLARISMRDLLVVVIPALLIVIAAFSAQAGTESQ
jgi:hypothetical protein